MSSNYVNPSLSDVDGNDKYPQVTQADLNRAKFRVGLDPAPRKPRAIMSWTSYAKSKEGVMNDAAVPYELGLLEDLADPDEAMAYLEAALEDGDQETFQLALRHVIGAQEAGNDAIGVADMDEEQLQLSTSDQFWTLISGRRRQQTTGRAELERRLEARDTTRQTLTVHHDTCHCRTKGRLHDRRRVSC